MGVSDKSLIPDLTEYRRAVIVQNITVENIKKLIDEFSHIYLEPVKKKCKFYMTPVPGDNTWIYIEFPYAEGIRHSRNFYNYQDLIIWLADHNEDTRGFGLAIPKDQSKPLFFSEPDHNNKWGDSVTGVYADREFSYQVLGEKFKWRSMPGQGFFDAKDFLYKEFGFDTGLLPEINKSKWEEFEVTLVFERECVESQ